MTPRIFLDTNSYPHQCKPHKTYHKPNLKTTKSPLRRYHLHTINSKCGKSYTRWTSTECISHHSDFTSGIMADHEDLRVDYYYTIKLGILSCLAHKGTSHNIKMQTEFVSLQTTAD